MPTPFELHYFAKRGDLLRVRELLRDEIDVNAYDNGGCTPLMHAVESSAASVELVRLLLEHGANIRQECSKWGTPRSIVALCLGAGDPRKLTLLLDNGAGLHDRRAGGYDALIDAVHGRDTLRSPDLIDLLKILIARGASLTGVTEYHESGLRVLSHVGRFDAVRLLLDSGADEAQLA